MKLKLNRPLCFFDLETTGVNITTDRIVEIAVLKLHPKGTREVKVWRVNPECPIPAQASAVHGIYDADVADEPNFKTLSKTIYNFIRNSDLAGYNSDRFDIPLLAEEMLRAEIDFDISDFKSVDVQTIFHKMEQRTLSAALKFYCNEELVDAHSAMADTRATFDVLMAQLERYDELDGDVDSLNFLPPEKNLLILQALSFIIKMGKNAFRLANIKVKPLKVYWRMSLVILVG